jgi:hypothetical protein
MLRFLGGGKSRRFDEAFDADPIVVGFASGEVAATRMVRHRLWGSLQDRGGIAL